MRSFRLSDPALAALAAGRPSSETLAELRKAQLSRHLLLLSEILRADSPTWYADQPGPGELADPMTGLYAATALAALRSGAPPPERPRLVRPGRILAATCENLTLRARLEDTDPLRDRLGLTPATRLTDAAAAHWQHCLDQAWHILVRRHRPAATTLAAVLRVIVPVEPDHGAAGISATSANAFGAVAMSAPADGPALAVALLHETQHSLLNAVHLLFGLVEPSTGLGYSPWRDDPRPAFGVLHGAYAYLSVTRFWRTEAAAGGGVGAFGDGAGGRRAAFEFARWRAAVVDAADGLLAGEALTAAGRRFTGALRDEAARWLAEPVDPEVGRLAAGANADHRARWRLRHLTVDPAALDALVKAWRAGAPPPPTPEPTVRSGVERQLERSDRLRRLHAWLAVGSGGRRGDQSPPPGGGVRPGDDAYLGGDLGTAHEAYLKDLDWSGLSITSPHPAVRARPELVRAVYLALGDAELPAVADWLR